MLMVMFDMRRLVSKALTNLMAHFIFLHIINLNHCDHLMKLWAWQSLSWEIAHLCCHREHFQHCTCLISCSFVVKRKWKHCEFMEFV
jgi:hypothetical protein